MDYFDHVGVWKWGHNRFKLFFSNCASQAVITIGIPNLFKVRGEELLNERLNFPKRNWESL